MEAFVLYEQVFTCGILNDGKRSVWHNSIGPQCMESFTFLLTLDTRNDNAPLIFAQPDSEICFASSIEERQNIKLLFSSNHSQCLPGQVFYAHTHTQLHILLHPAGNNFVPSSVVVVEFRGWDS